MVDELMTGDGWAKNDEGIWEKDEGTASFEVSTTADDPTRELVEELWQSQLQAAGFEVTIKNRSPEVLFGRLAPRGRFDVLLASLVGTPDPGLCSVFCSKNIPPEGQNFFRTDDPAIDEALEAVDSTIDDAARIAAAQAGQQALAEYVAGIPLYQLPTVFIYDDDLLGGVLEDNTVMGPFFTMNEWTLEG
jgi:peptide/nickel transport system substrate-binding protein